MNTFKKIVLIILVVLISCQQTNTNVYSNEEIAGYLKISRDTRRPFAQRNFANDCALAILKTSSNNIPNRELLLKTSNIYFSINAWKKFRETSDILLLRSEKVNDTLMIANAFRNLGLYFDNTSVNDSALYYFSKAKKIYISSRQYSDLCDIYQDVAEVCYYTNDFIGCEQALINALKIAAPLKLTASLFAINNSLGFVSDQLNEPQNAIKYFSKAFAVANIHQNVLSKTALNLCYYNFGTHFLNLQKYASAQQYFRKALRTSTICASNPSLYTMLLDNLAFANLQLGDTISCARLLLNSELVRNKHQIDQGKNYNKLYMSHYYAVINDTVKALSYAREAYNLSKSFRAPKDMLLCLKQLALVEPNRSQEHLQRYIHIADSMQQMERETRNKFAKIAYETEEITREKDNAVKEKNTIAKTSASIVTVLLLISIILYQRHRQQKLVLIQNQHEANEEIFRLIQEQQSKIDQGRDSEKKRIARELHDGVMNRLSSTRFNLHILKKSQDPETIEKCLTYIDNLQDIEKEIRNISHNLNGDILGGKDTFRPILDSLLADQQKIIDSEWHIEIDNDINWELVSNEIKVHIYRIIQEALQNIRKHAGAKKIILSLIYHNENLILEIYDDGIGFSLKGRKKGIGLQNMYARVKSCNGHIEIDTKKGGGSNLTITLPVAI